MTNLFEAQYQAKMMLSYAWNLSSPSTPLNISGSCFLMMLPQGVYEIPGKSRQSKLGIGGVLPIVSANAKHLGYSSTRCLLNFDDDFSLHQKPGPDYL